ncbi:MAG: hypothetical protein LBL37_05590 [Gracilibacteraceae bacterium]|jgi:hypothetical protein|nr:hypothetical protein [Gracilibacteraceae bacterium]
MKSRRVGAALLAIGGFALLAACARPALKRRGRVRSPRGKVWWDKVGRKAVVALLTIAGVALLAACAQSALLDRSLAGAAVRACSSVAGEILTPRDFVSFDDRGLTRLSFAAEPDFDALGRQSVRLSFSLGWRHETLESSLTVLPGSRNVTVEAGETPEAEDFVQAASGHTAVLAAEAAAVDWSEAGVTREVVLILDGRPLVCAVTVADTTPPVAAPREGVWTWVGEPLAPADLLTDISDASAVTVAFQREPDWTTAGPAAAELVLTDEFGNAALLTVTAAVRRDEEPPVITGARDHAVLVGGRADLRTGVAALDDRDGQVEVTVDSSAVDFDRSGRYPVYYAAADQSGNQSQATVYVAVGEITDEYVYGLADQVLSKIITAGMSDREIVKQIHDWVRANNLYLDYGEKGNVLRGAYNAFTAGRGDCYTFYAVSEVLLTRAGIENIGVRRAGGPAEHYWNLIFIDGGWYHYDASPYFIYFDGSIFTESQARQYTQARDPRRHYYDYDADLYPEVVW